MTAFRFPKSQPPAKRPANGLCLVTPADDAALYAFLRYPAFGSLSAKVDTTSRAFLT